MGIQLPPDLPSGNQSLHKDLHPTAKTDLEPLASKVSCRPSGRMLSTALTLQMAPCPIVHLDVLRGAEFGFASEPAEMEDKMGRMGRKWSWRGLKSWLLQAYMVTNESDIDGEVPRGKTVIRSRFPRSPVAWPNIVAEAQNRHFAQVFPATFIPSD